MWARLRTCSRKYPGAQVVGDDYGIVIPGLVNAHTHMSEALIPGMAENLSIWVWGARLLMPVMPHLTREMARVGTLFRGAELIRSGVTTLNDMFCHSQSVRLCEPRRGGRTRRTRPARRRCVWGGRHRLGRRRLRSRCRELWKSTDALAERCAASEARLLPRGSGDDPGPNRCAARSVERARAVDGQRRIHTHLAEVREEKTAAQLRWGKSTVEHADEVGTPGRELRRRAWRVALGGRDGTDCRNEMRRSSTIPPPT